MTTVVCDTAIVRDEPHCVVWSNEIRIGLGELYRDGSGVVGKRGTTTVPFTVSQSVGIVAGYSYNETVNPWNN